MRTIRLRDSRPPAVRARDEQSDRPAARVRLNSRWIEIEGAPVIPVTGELHFSRIPRARWEETLRLMVASGLTSVSTYLFWIHHEPVRGEISFEGDLDIAAFIETAERVGVDVIIRIGPWCHGEARNGGHPDWVVEAAPARGRTIPCTWSSHAAGTSRWRGRSPASAVPTAGSSASRSRTSCTTSPSTSPR